MVVVSGGPTPPEARWVMDDLMGRGCLVREIAGGRTGPHPLLLAGRLLEPIVLERRAEYLRIVGSLPREIGYFMRYLRLPESDAWNESVAKMASGADLATVDATSDAAPIDLLTMVAQADLVVTDSLDLLALAAGLGRRAVGVVPPGPDGQEQMGALAGSQLATRPEQLREQGRLPADVGADAEGRDELVRQADLFFDDMSLELSHRGGERSARSVPPRVADLTDKVAALSAVNAGLRDRMAREREVMARYVRSLPAAPQSDGTDARVSLREAEAEIKRLHEQVERSRAEIASIYATRTMRLLRPARQVYTRLRSRHR
jgi:hypothetical protein